MAEIEQIPKAITTPCGSPIRLAAAITKELTIPINMPITGKNLEAFGMDGFDKTKPPGTENLVRKVRLICKSSSQSCSGSSSCSVSEFSTSGISASFSVIILQQSNITDSKVEKYINFL